ncbi:hypothetical protein RUND412_008619 [Rhizina undulata]
MPPLTFSQKMTSTRTSMDELSGGSAITSAVPVETPQSNTAENIPVPVSPSTRRRRRFLLSRVLFNPKIHPETNRFTRILSTTPYVCHYKTCGLPFPSLDDLKEHLTACTHDVFICCHSLYPDLEAVLSHRENTGCLLLVPKNCIFEEWWARKGPFVESFVASGIRCAYEKCGREFPGLDALRDHLFLCSRRKSKSEGGGHSIYGCCGAFFPSQEALFAHWNGARAGREVCLSILIDSSDRPLPRGNENRSNADGGRMQK